MTAFYQSTAWRHFRLRRLAQNPICQWSANKFDAELEKYYSTDSEFTKHFTKTMRSVVEATSNAVSNDVSSQIDGDVGDGTEFANEYLDAMTLRYTSSSKRQ